MIKLTQKKVRELVAEGIGKDLTREGFTRVGMKVIGYAEHTGGRIMALLMVDYNGTLCVIQGRNKLLVNYLKEYNIRG